ncbi:hypothetical protein IMCC3317_40490 [Kordia antarctica]|uniref:Uncharacterized protein n=2 Tax=Kordia antarctica TaxID=1218801 RepID=A0A7L4ZPV1_9FLAO|nr:hypothetical protein IMCC3317_40490 [Kordia antarctica]
MCIRQFEIKQVKAPFLSKPHYSISGLDQLGLNLTSERIFDLILPGLNNVTQRIRYYSFYCWFFDWYASDIGNTSAKVQNTYLRRAEFLAALVAAHRNNGGVPGITKAKAIYEKSSDVIELVLGTQEGSTSEGSYWKNSRGILGQYYINSIKQLGILRDQGDNAGLYVRTHFEHDYKVSGKQLAEAFRNNISSRESLFIDCVKNNSICKDSLEELSNFFDLTQVPKNSDEEKLLWQLLTGVDKPKENEESFLRKSTVDLLLRDIDSLETEEKYNQLSVPLKIYNEKLNEDSDSTSKLWYFFMLEQFWSVACTGCLNAILSIIEDKAGNSWFDETTLIKHTVEEITQIFNSKNVNTDNQLFFDGTIIDYRIDKLVDLSKKEKNPYLKILWAICAIQKLYIDNRSNRDVLLKVSQQYKIHTPSSFLNTLTDFDKKQSLVIEDFLYYFITRYVLNRHHFVALRKLNSTQNTAKFYREEGMIRYISSFLYDYSSPRIHTLYDFLSDLNVIDKKNKSITSSGRQKLKDLV